jgi:hypothetical protein
MNNFILGNPQKSQLKQLHLFKGLKVLNSSTYPKSQIENSLVPACPGWV